MSNYLLFSKVVMLVMHTLGLKTNSISLKTSFRRPGMSSITESQCTPLEGWDHLLFWYRVCFSILFCCPLPAPQAGLKAAPQTPRTSSSVCPTGTALGCQPLPPGPSQSWSSARPHNGHWATGHKGNQAQPRTGPGQPGHLRGLAQTDADCFP